SAVAQQLRSAFVQKNVLWPADLWPGYLFSVNGHCQAAAEKPGPSDRCDRHASFGFKWTTDQCICRKYTLSHHPESRRNLVLDLHQLYVPVEQHALADGTGLVHPS